MKKENPSYRKLKPNETCYVKRKYTISKSFVFNGKEKIKLRKLSCSESERLLAQIRLSIIQFLK